MHPTPSQKTDAEFYLQFCILSSHLGKKWFSKNFLYLCSIWLLWACKNEMRYSKFLVCRKITMQRKLWIISVAQWGDMLSLLSLTEIQNALYRKCFLYRWLQLVCDGFYGSRCAIDFNNLKNSIHMLYVNRSKTTPLREFEVPVWGYSILYHPEQEPKNT